MKRAVVMLASVIMSLSINVTSFGQQRADARFEGELWYDAVKTITGDSRFSKTRIFEENREPTRSYFVPYDTKEKALQRNKEASPFYKLLNGNDWKFKLVDKPADAILNFQDENYDTSDWEYIQVPLSWQMAGYDSPIYTNINYPWSNFEAVSNSIQLQAKAPTVYNPVGHYKKTFTVPDNWKDRETFVSFHGVEAGFYLYINGEYVGYGEDSFTHDEFNITDYLKEGENTISVRVYRWTDGSWLENQDYIRLSGIFRNVELYSKADVEIRDFFATTDFDANYENATLNLDVDVRSFKTVLPSNYKVRVSLLEDNKTTALINNEIIPVSFGANGEVRLKKQFNVTSPHKWSAETPYLYNLVLELLDGENNVVEAINHRLGFREIEIKNIGTTNKQQITINGQNLMIRGVNRHEVHPTNGRYLDRSFIEQDIKLMKQNNINAIRNSHYPNSWDLYDLADEYGIYICDEANIESHYGRDSFPSNIEEWRAVSLDRMVNMVERTKNHSSVIIWSLGNEASEEWTPVDGNAFKLMSEWAKQRDPSRFIKYERDNRWTDIFSVQYPNYQDVINYINNANNTKPYIMSEYAHAMGNSLGYFAKYWETFRTNLQAQGGFIWDWADQTPIWDIPERMTDSKVKDLSKNKYDVGATGLAESTGKPNASAEDSALSGGLEIEGASALNFYGNTPFTLEAVVKPTALGGHRTIIGKGDEQYVLKTNGNKLEFTVYSTTPGVGWQSVMYDVNPNEWNGKWHNIAGVFTGSEIKLYLNGKQVGNSTSISGSVKQTSYNFSIGKCSQISARTFGGLIDDVKVYNRALTPEELSGETPNDDSVQLWLNFDEIQPGVPLESKGPVVAEGKYYAYGGDWIDKAVNDGNFLANGIVSSDRTPHPTLAQVKQVHQEISFYDIDVANGEIEISNEFLFNNTDKYKFKWELLEDHKVIDSGIIENLSIQPLTKQTIVIPFSLPETPKEGAEYFLNISALHKTQPKWLDNNWESFVLAKEQFKLNVKTDRRQLDIANMPNISYTESDNAVVITGQNFTATFDKQTGVISSYVYNGTELMVDGAAPNYYRPPVDNDRENGFIGRTATWRNAAKNRTVNSVNISPVNDGSQNKGVKFEIKATLPTSPSTSAYASTVTVYGSGDIVYDQTLNPGTNITAEIPVVGTLMKVDGQFKNLTYYGRGPEENYRDRQDASDVGVYKTTVSEQFVHYVEPQEHGNRSDIRFAALTNDNGLGFMVSSDTNFEINASHFEQNNITNSKHPYELTPSDDIYFKVNHLTMGVGGRDSWGARPDEYVTIRPNKAYKYSFMFSPINNLGVDEMMNKSKISLKVPVVYGNEVYLSDLEYDPSSYSGWGSIQKDTNLDGNPLKLLVGGAEKAFSKGIGTHATSEITYNIEGLGFTKFQSYVGVDRSQAHSANPLLTFKVIADGKTIYDSGEMRSTDNAKFVDLGIKDVKVLKLYVDMGARDANDHADWADAKLIKAMEHDINGDQKVDLHDVITALKIITGKITEGDNYYDGNMTIEQAQEILNHIVLKDIKK